LVSCPLCERDQLRASVAELEQQLQYERDHSKMLSEANAALHAEKRTVEEYCAKIRGEYTAAARERDEARGEVERLRELLGDWRFYLTRQIVFAADGQPVSQWDVITPVLQERIDAALSAKGNSDG
jgi:hypothetical protein